MLGENLSFVEQLYELYLQDPNQVDAEWRAFFAPLRDGGAARRTSFQPRSIFAPTGGANGQVVAGESAEVVRQARVGMLIDAYRASGHLAAELDPLERPRPPRRELDLAYHRLGEDDLDQLCSIPDHMGGGQLTVRELVAKLQRTYCRSVGVQLSHVDDLQMRDWLIERMESCENCVELSREQKLHILTKLTEAEVLERFIQRKYLGAKSFSLEGGESLIPLLDLAIEHCAEHGMQEVVIGMAHRGRLNVLVNTMKKPASDVLREFEDKDPELFFGRGDVKYHLGHQAKVTTESGAEILLTLCFNPSHLEFVGPVVMGRVRARQDQHGDPGRSRALPLVIHGDSAFAGEGVVQEMLNLHALQGYETGGTLHVIVNNQIGFTTPPESARSTTYATDVARLLQSPIFHVNGESPESVAYVIGLAMDFRARFRKDVVVDLYCYRKHGHNEGDEPAFTQPLMYEAIRKRQSVRESYLEHLLRPGEISREQADRIAQEHDEYLEAELAAAQQEGFKRQRSRLTGRWNGFMGGPEESAGGVETAVPLERLREQLLAQSQVPEWFSPHSKIKRLLDLRRAQAEGERPLDWAAGEALAFSSLVSDGHGVRLSGQDAGRGTFSHRHSVLHDQQDGRTFLPLQHLPGEGLGHFEVWDSPLTETAVLAFEYGYSLDAPRSLCIWEAQFGDFANVAQVIFDQFISSGEDKWDLLCGLVSLLPHGFEGQGPEHSSARLERYLQLCAEDNMQVMNLTTPAQLFHCLRRQVLRAWRKPLVVMSPKSLLRRPDATSSLEDLATGGFQRVIPDPGGPAGVRRVLLCSGKVYYDLAAHREEHGHDDVAILRLEQLYPLPHEDIQALLGAYPHEAELVWVQEEPWNMGAWFYLRARLTRGVFEARALRCVSRQESASPATGSAASHKLEQKALLEKAFGGESA